VSFSAQLATPDMVQHERLGMYHLRHKPTRRHGGKDMHGPLRP
jgi:hypothetical protein